MERQKKEGRPGGKVVGDPYPKILGSKIRH